MPARNSSEVRISYFCNSQFLLPDMSPPVKFEMVQFGLWVRFGVTFTANTNINTKSQQAPLIRMYFQFMITFKAIFLMQFKVLQLKVEVLSLCTGSQVFITYLLSFCFVLLHCNDSSSFSPHLLNSSTVVASLVRGSSGLCRHEVWCHIFSCMSIMAVKVDRVCHCPDISNNLVFIIGTIYFDTFEWIW